MRKKILTAMNLVAAAALILSYIGIIAFYYQQNRSTFEASLRESGVLLSISLDSQSGDERHDILEKYHRSTPTTRLTLVDPQGKVVFDTDHEPATMENHNSRPEIVMARTKPNGSAITRESATLQRDMSYFAKKLSDDYVVRVSRPMYTLYATVLSGLPVFVGIAVVVFGMAMLLAWRQAQILTSPLDNIDLNNPLDPDKPMYPEFRPLLERLEVQNQDKEEAARARREFSANVSHELKTPLTSISGYAEIIRNGLVQPADLPGFADRIYQESQRLLTLIADIMEISRLDEGVLPSETSEVDIFELCKVVVTRLQPRAMEFFVALSLSGEHASVRGVKAMLDEMVFNLVENAVKYNHEGGHVKVWAGKSMGRAQIVVEDDGIGIPLEDQERIFERFYRVDKSHSRETGGTGLGLSIVKHTALMHKAEIAVHSTVGEGTRIEVTFPAQ